jgi:putative serine protease PepD
MSADVLDQGPDQPDGREESDTAEPSVVPGDEARAPDVTPADAGPEEVTAAEVTAEAHPADAGAPRRRLAGFILAGLLTGALGAIFSAAIILGLSRDESPAPTSTSAVVSTIPSESLSTAAVVARRVIPSIVTVEVGSEAAGEFVANASGSGVVLRADGLLVTNQHVIAGAGQVRVIFSDGHTYPAEVTGADEATDLAVLRVDATGLTPIAIGSTTSLSIGDTAIAVGSPLGLAGGPSVTEGVVSAFNRRVAADQGAEMFGMLQTDAPITRGSSGGALVDDEGRLIGITTAIGVSDVGAEGLGFAIPVELVTRVTDDLIATGKATHPFLGITGTTYLRPEADGSTVPAGVSVVSVMPDTAAAAAGMAVGDLILSYDGTPVTVMEQLVVAMRLYRVGDKVNFEIDRGGTLLTVEVTLAERPEGV